MLAFRTLSFIYIKYFFIVLIALCAFIVGFDLMENSSDLPSSANLVILYISYKIMYAIDLMLPLSLVFAMIASMVALVRSNEFGAYYAIGYSKARIILPFLAISIISILIYISLHFSDFSKANEFAKNIKDASLSSKPTENLFFSHNGDYIYIQKLYPLSKSAEVVKIFSFDGEFLVAELESDSAVYENESWRLSDVDAIYPPRDFSSMSGYKSEHIDSVTLLENFKPKILDQIYEGRANFNILDGFDALNLLENQNVDVAKIKNSIYKVFITPWFAIFMVIVVFVSTPISSRFMSMSRFSFTVILASLLIWGVLYVMGELSSNKVFAPEIGVIFPMALLATFTLYRLLFSKQI